MAKDETELVKQAKELPAPERFSLAPRTFEEAYRFANFIAASDLVPKDFRDKPANVLIAVQLAMELGLTPMQGLQSIYVVNGRPALFGDALPALVLASGLLESIDETGDDKNASCTVKRKGMPPITRTYSMAEAAKVPYKEFDKWITLAEKSTYKAYGKRMLQMRARSYAFRDAFADVLKGVAIKEEIEDALDVTPPEPIKTPQPLENKADEPKRRVHDARTDGGDPRPDGDRPSAMDGESTNKTVKTPRGDKSKDASALPEHEATDPKPSKEDLAILKIDSYEKETFPGGEALTELIRDFKGDNAAQTRICKHWNDRKKELDV